MTVIQKTKDFNIEKSADYVKDKYIQWQKRTVEIVKHLYWAKKHFLNQGVRNDLGKNLPKLNCFQAYLNYVKISKQTANNWIDRYEPKRQILLTLSEFKQEKIAKEVIQKDKILKYKKTGKKPDNWTRADDYQFKKHHDDNSRTERIKKVCKEMDDKKEQKKVNQKIFDDNLDKALDIEKKRNDMYKKFETDGSLSGLFDIVNGYLEGLNDNNRRIESSQNIIKFCRNKIIEWQKN